MKTFRITLRRTVISAVDIQAKDLKELRAKLKGMDKHEMMLDAPIYGIDNTVVAKIEETKA